MGERYPKIITVGKNLMNIGREGATFSDETGKRLRNLPQQLEAALTSGTGSINVEDERISVRYERTSLDSVSVVPGETSVRTFQYNRTR